jgi:sugar lactone lactonase YvrE
MNARETMDLARISYLGSGLVRPECVVTHETGWTFAADWQDQGGVACISPDGHVHKIKARRREDDPLRPNGIALEAGGSFLIAHLGETSGGLFRLHPNGDCEPVLVSLEDGPLPPSNFPLVDRKGRIWLTVSTRLMPRARDYRLDAATGFIVLIENGSARIVADGLGYTNECLLSEDESQLFVNETFARRLSRFDVGADGSLSNQTVIARFGPGTFPDGVAMDDQGDLWITSIVSNRIIRVTPGGVQTMMLEENDRQHLDETEKAFVEGWMGRRHLDGSPARHLRNISSLAFGGPDLRMAYLGCLLGDAIPVFTSPVRGLPSLSFTAPLGPLPIQGF